MGFRLLNLNPTRRIYMSTKVSSYSPKNSTTYNHSPPQSALIIQVFGHYSFPNSPNPNFNIPKRWHMGHSHHHHDDRDLRTKDGERIFRLGLAADIGLAAGKALTGYISGSTAIIADAAHSLSDVVLSSVALLSFKAAKSPKDKEHPYGHGKFETLGALGMSGMLLATAGGIAWHSLDLLLGLWSAAPEIINQSISDDHLGSHHHGLDMEHPVLALNMTIVSIAIKEGLYWISKRTAERTGSGLMKVNAWHHRVDAISSVVALIGVGGSILGVKFLDPLAGLVVSGMILKAGLETGYQSVLELVDAAVPLEQLVSFRQAILQVEGVKGCNHLRGRKAGSSLYLDANIEVDPFSSVSAAHEVGENVRCQIQRSHPEVAEVFIHLEPSTSHIPSSIEYQKKNMKEADHKSSSVSSENGDIEELISNILSSKFSERMTVERITRHLLQGKILLQIEVSMPDDILIRDAKKIAAEAEKHILSAASNIMQVCIQLRLGHAIPNFNHELQDRNKDKPDYAHVSNPGSN